MIKLDDIIINADMMDILQVLKSDLSIKGIDRFKIFKPNNDNIQTQCPFHKGGQEKKPSFGINTITGQCHCFACGWSGKLNRMIGEVFLQDEEYGTKWLIRHFNSTEVETRQKIVDLPTSRHPLGVAINNICQDTLDNLDKYRWVHSYMYERGLNDELIEKFDIGYDKDTNCITFPVYDKDNRLVFVAKRSVTGKMYKYPPNVEKPVYGLNIVSSAYVYVVESFFNCLTLWKFGLPAVALMGTGTPSQYQILKNSNIRTFILALDPDDAGRKGTQRFRNALGRYKTIKEVAYTEEGKDINDLQEKFLDLQIIL